VYAEPFNYGLDKLSHEQTHCTNAFCILSVHEVGYQTAEQSGLMICAQLCDMYNRIYVANEHAQFCGIARSIHVEYGINLLFF
jgi:hypothetical protein